jgi:norsolorinic acid ketoreductase
MRLFQACLPLLHKAEKPIFVCMSSMARSIAATGVVPSPVGLYGASEAASNFLVRRARQEHPELIIFAMHSGYVCSYIREMLYTDTPPNAVKTPGVTAVVESMGMAEIPDFTTLEKSIEGMMERVSGFSIIIVRGLCLY